MIFPLAGGRGAVGLSNSAANIKITSYIKTEYYGQICQAYQKLMATTRRKHDKICFSSTALAVSVSASVSVAVSVSIGVDVSVDVSLFWPAHCRNRVSHEKALASPECHMEHEN